MSKIPIRNLYYLLSYAWDVLEQAEETRVNHDATRSAPELLATLLAGGVEMLARCGLLRDYCPRTEETSRLQGKLDFSSSLRRLSHKQARMVCQFDERDVNTPANGLIRATIDQLMRADVLDGEVRRRIWEASACMSAVKPLTLSLGEFRRVVMHRSQRHYRLVLAVCEMLHRLAQPEEGGENWRFRDFWRDDGLPRLFESFVRKFLQRHAGADHVGGSNFPWLAEGTTEEAQALLPIMKTDVTLSWSDRRCLILDCKFYANTFSGRYEPKIDSGHLYQMAAYLQNHPLRQRGHAMHGLLLFPAIEADFFHRYSFMNSTLTVASLPLHAPWETLHRRLLDIVHEAASDVVPAPVASLGA